MQQFVSVPLSTFRLMERAAKKWLQEEPIKGEWVTARKFAQLTGLTKDQIRYLRATNPELVKAKPNSTQYLYDITGYRKMNTGKNA